jgi:hypothetical protein
LSTWRLAQVALTVMLGLGWTGNAAALCGGPLTENNFNRPLDVNDAAERDNIRVVERVHFTPEVAGLIRGSTSKLPGDIHYTLRHIPNHYGALDAMARFQLREKAPQSTRYWTVDCYFERAFAFRPKDSRLFLLYGIYLHRANRLDEAVASYAHAEELGSTSPELYYNRGLLEFERDNLDTAAAYAAKAYAGGYPLPALRDKLSSAGIPIPPS